jgi:hypothetical protein
MKHLIHMDSNNYLFNFKHYFKDILLFIYLKELVLVLNGSLYYEYTLYDFNFYIQ